MLDAEFVKAIGDLAVAAKKSEKVLDEPGRIVLWHEGQTIDVAKLPAPREHTLATLDDVVRIAARDAEQDDGVEIFVGGSDIVVLLDALSGRCETATLPLLHSSRFQVLQGLSLARPMGPKEAIRFLRYSLDGGEHVVQSLRRVDFTRKSTGSRTIEHGRESLGKAVEAQVQQADTIPDRFGYSVPVFLTPGARGLSQVDIEVAVEIDVESEGVIFRVLPDDLQTAVFTALDQVAEYLRGELGAEIPVYRGEL